MYKTACNKKLSEILFSEHARASSISWFPSFAAEVRALEKDTCKAHVGAETRICDNNGTLDTCNEILELCDFIVASVHRFPGEEHSLSKENFSPEKAIEIEYALSCAAINNPNVDILGHPFGMCISRFNIEPSEHYWLSLFQMAAEKDVAIELNAKYHKYMLKKIIIWCKQTGVRISPGSDAHSKDEVGNICTLIKGFL